MYQIYEQPDGTYQGACRIQDGTEWFTATTLEEAVETMKKWAKTLNNSKIKKKDIALYRQVPKVVENWTQVEWPK